MEEQEDGWLTVLEKNGLGPAAAIFENYGIDSETDLLVLDPDDFSKLAARGLKPLHVKKLERWCESVHEREKNMLPNAPTAAALLSSEALNVVTPAAHSVGAEASECESGAENESERDGEEDDDDSDDDLEIVGEQSGTADSTGASSAGTEAPAKKAKITLTAEQEKFAKQFRPPASKIDRPRKIPTRHLTGRGASIKKQGTRRHDVKPGTLQKRLLNFPDQFLQAQGGQLFCAACCTNVGSSNSAVKQHLQTMQHTTKVQQKLAGSRDGVRLLECIAQYKGVVRSQAGGQEPVGFAQVPETVQVIRAELLQEMLRAGIEVKKVNKIRGWLERRMSVPLLDADNLVRQYIKWVLKRPIKWVSKRAGIEQLSIEWELGSGDDGYIAGQVTYAEPEVSDLSKPSASNGKFLTDAQYAFTLEPYVNGTPAPTLVTKEVDMALAAPFLLVNPDFSKTEVVKAYAHSIVAPAIDYWKQTIEGKKGDQLERMKTVRIFNPLHVLGNKISESDIDGLKIFKFYEHPEIRPQIELMKTEVMQYQALAGSIKSFEERKDSKGKDTFALSDWWKSNCATLPGFAYVLRAVLTNSPNSCPPERLFSIFNATYDDDQKSSYADYIELSMQSQFNKRVLP
jgi:hypothetical protein